jgi:hypothetical protein
MILPADGRQGDLRVQPPPVWRQLDLPVWRTRRTLFAAVWLEVEALLRQDAGLQAKTIWTD